jgi:hypothetical protein
VFVFRTNAGTAEKKKMCRRNIGPIVTGLLSRSRRGAALARVYRGDVRDVERIKKVQEIMDNKENLPKFLFKPKSDWCGHAPHPTRVLLLLLLLLLLRMKLTRNLLPRIIRSDRDWEEANNDPFEALKILRAMQKETPHLSDEFIACVWVFMQDGVFPEFKTVTNLDDTNNLPFAKPRGGKTLAGAVKNQLPEGFYDASDFAQEEGVFYVQAPVQSCEAMKAAIDAMKLEKDTDEIFFDNSRLNADKLLANDLTFGATLYAGQSDRDADVRLAEKARSTQLFGRHLRAAVCVNIPSELGVAVDADGDDDQLPDSDPEASDDNVSYEDLIDSVASRMAVLNKVFATKRFFTAVARVTCEAYSARNWGFSAMEEDFEAMIAAVTGSMIERGGTNVALLGCLPGKEQTRFESMFPAHRAFCWMKDDAFIEMQRRGCDVDTFEKAYTDVQGRRAKTVFATSLDFLGRLEALAADVEKGGVAVLAAADAKALEDEGADPPTYHNMDAGTFARALAAESGRKGAATKAQMFADVDNGIASPEVVRSVENMRNGMGWLTPDEHYAAAVAAGGDPRTPAGTTCGTCRTDKSLPHWYDSPDVPGGKVCKGCSARARAERLSKAGTTCGTCETTETSCWCNSPDVPGGKICKGCYTKDWRRKKQKK